MKKKVLLIDGNSFCYRAFYAIRGLSTSKGQPTNAIYGFVAMLNKLRAEHRPDYLAVTFDLKGPTFRHKRFADYKVHRKPMPDELSVQFPVIKRILRAYRIPIFEKEGYEADDIIATLAKKLADTELEVLIVTGDKDILQLVSNAVKVINAHKDNLILDEAWVKKRFGVGPEKVIEIMALAGDASDNIPGVPGIGEATAIELIKRFGTLDEVLANADKITNKARSERIKKFAELARMSRELARLDCDVPQLAPLGSRHLTGQAQREPSDLLAELKVVEADNERLFEIFKELEFKSLMQKVAREFKDEIDYNVCGRDETEEYFKDFSKEESVTLYLAAGPRLDPMAAKITGIAFAFEKKKPLFFSLEQTSKDRLKPIFENKNIKKIGHNLKYAKVLLSNYGITLQGISFDTMIASYLLEPARLKYGLGDLALEYLNCNLPAPGTDREAAKVCFQNVTVIFRLSEILRGKLKQKNLLALFQNIEMPLIEVLADMEKEGVALDKDLLLHLSRDFDGKLTHLTKEIYEMTGESFNINSPKQLSCVLFEKLKLPRIKRTKTQQHSTDTEVLRKLSTAHPVAQSLLEFREISKLKSTYIDGMMKLLHSGTGKIHTSFNQTGTVTGRLSSSRPNLQNIPIKTSLGKKIRQVFIPAEKGSLLLSADYSQIELRILAHLSGDKNLISAFKEDLDIHAYTASLIFDVSADKVSSQMRDTAKTVNFGITYGMSAYGLSKDLGVGLNQAQEFIDAYFARYPGVKSYINRQIEKAERYGFVTTLMKRRRYIPQIKSLDENTRRFAQRVAINAPVQGSASDLIKAAMVEIHRRLKAQNLSTSMIIQVHDELVFSVPQGELAGVRALIKDKMENVTRLNVPVKVAIKTGKNWLEVR
ncbi:MAG: DNA polymerase I [Candidatus Omnitrophica bacterium]|nr:DNA polymerase I [Candidatus Omnitrophota bacterium]